MRSRRNSPTGVLPYSVAGFCLAFMDDSPGDIVVFFGFWRTQMNSLFFAAASASPRPPCTRNGAVRLFPCVCPELPAQSAVKFVKLHASTCVPYNNPSHHSAPTAPVWVDVEWFGTPLALPWPAEPTGIKAAMHRRYHPRVSHPTRGTYVFFWGGRRGGGRGGGNGGRI